MNRRTLGAFGAVGLLALIIILQNIKFGSDVPELKKWAEPADVIEVTAKDYRLQLYMKEGRWVINDQAYPADENSVGSLEMKIRELKITDLVSEKGFYDRYDLADDRAVTVTAKRGGALLRTLVIGKRGSKSSHAFVRVDNRPEVYLASGIGREDFMPQPDALRDKVIFDLKGMEVESFTLTAAGRSYSFYKKAPEAEKSETGESGVSSWRCKGYDKLVLDDSAINNILYIFSPLRAVTFPEDKKEGQIGSLYASAIIKAGGEEYDLNIYSKKENDYNYAMSSKNQYIFTVGSWQIEKLAIKNIKDLVKK